MFIPNRNCGEFQFGRNILRSTRPVGVAIALDGSLFVTDDGSQSIGRVSYSGR